MGFVDNCLMEIIRHHGFSVFVSLLQLDPVSLTPSPLLNLEAVAEAHGPEVGLHVLAEELTLVAD